MTGNRRDLTQLVSTVQPLEVFCDESGSDGENLIGGNTDVFAHAGVRVSLESVADSIQEIRNRIRSPAEEYKANHLLRGKHRSTLEWTLGPSGPIHGNAHVHLTDKAFFVVGRVVELLVAETGRPTGTLALTLYREGPRTVGGEQWQAFLESSNNLMRTKNRWDARTPVDSFFHLLDTLCPASAGSQVGEILELLRRSRPLADSFWAQSLENPTMIPSLDPLIPAIAQTVAYWSRNGRPVSIVHDEQNALTEERIAWLKDQFSGPQRRLAGVRFVDSRSDPRVQLADFLAGVARKIASDELNGRGDRELTALLRPYVDSSSIWGDDRSRHLLGPAPQDDQAV
ncbi:DUF3800 domain-containing protein [Streptomyces sp. NPDC029004]|uniref:DUF3800 domain-containing protein n=1 Tax=Streptomyces sp. NPDC029004 TaxID=3154490 RepID=UPI0033F15222